MATVAEPGADQDFELIRAVGVSEPNQGRKKKKAKEKPTDAVETIRLEYKGFRLHVHRGPTSRKVSKAKNAEAARAVGADSRSTTLMKRVFNSDEPAIKAINKVYSQINSTARDRYWTLPTPHDGLRLVRRSKMAELDKKLHELSDQLANQAKILKAALPAIIERERERSPGLFDEAVYNSFDPVRDCGITWYYPVVMEDKELAEIDQNVYKREIGRVHHELQACVDKCMEEMTLELFEAINNAAKSLENDATGRRKRFHSGTVVRLFDELAVLQHQLDENKIGSEGMSATMKKLRGLLQGNDRENLPDALKKNDKLRQNFASSCRDLGKQMVDKAEPAMRRRLLLKKKDD